MERRGSSFLMTPGVPVRRQHPGHSAFACLLGLRFCPRFLLLVVGCTWVSESCQLSFPLSTEGRDILRLVTFCLKPDGRRE